MSGAALRRVAIGALAVGVLAGCSGSSGSSGSSNDASTSSSTVPEATAAWVGKWKPTLISDYGPAQRAFLAAIEGGQVAGVQTTARTVTTANARLSTAIVDAGPPPPAATADVRRLLEGLSSEATLVAAVSETCTGSDGRCQSAVTAFAKNNSKQIVPALTGLGATG
jgi:hypothetical protein